MNISLSVRFFTSIALNVTDDMERLKNESTSEEYAALVWLVDSVLIHSTVIS